MARFILQQFDPCPIGHDGVFDDAGAARTQVLALDIQSKYLFVDSQGDQYHEYFVPGTPDVQNCGGYVDKVVLYRDPALFEHLLKHGVSGQAFARDEFPRALLAQTRTDGGLNEASLRYHAFVTEMALLCRLALGVPFPAAAEDRLREMCQIVADFKDATGDVFPFGDDDSGRVLGVDFASTMGRAEILLHLAGTVFGCEFKTTSESLRGGSGWWVRWAGEFTVALDFGGVGLNGQGGHAHNDDFSLCLEWRNRPVIVDPGTYLYTTDPEARNRFRSALSHNTLIVDGREQRALTAGVFTLPGPDAAFHAARLRGDTWAFSRQVASGLAHRREVCAVSKEVSVRDVVEGSGSHRLEWRFHLHPSVEASVVTNGFRLVVPGAGNLLLEASGGALAFKVEESEYSPAYGQRDPAKVCVANGTTELPFSIAWTLHPVG